MRVSWGRRARPGWLVLGCWVVFATALRAAPGGVILTVAAGAGDGLEALPALASMVWQPELLLRASCPTIDDAADRVAEALAADPAAPEWVRLEPLDMTTVGDCATCQPPPLDPHRVTTDAPPTALDPRQYEFFAAVAERLKPTRFRPVVVVPAGGAPPALPMPDNLHFLLAGPAGAAQFRADTLAARQEQSAAWEHHGLAYANLLSDGLGDFYGLPLNGDLLRPLASDLPHPAILARNAASYQETGPDWLTERLRAVLVEQQTTPAGDLWRADDPALARAVDIFAPVAERLEAGSLPRATLAALAAVEAWDRDRTPATAAAAVRQLEQRRDQRGGYEPAGVLSAEFASFLGSAGALPALTLASPPAGVVIDSIITPEEWQGATRLTLDQDRFGQPTDRPATVWLAADTTGLSLAVIATEPDPAQATLADRLVLRAATATGELVRIDLPVGQPTARQEGPGGEAVPLRGLTREAGFDGPGWVLEARLSWSELGLAPEHLARLTVTTEHRAGALRTTTAASPDGGADWNPRRWPAVRLGARTPAP